MCSRGVDLNLKTLTSNLLVLRCRKRCQNSDWLSVHLPLTEQTRGFVDGKIIGAMPEGSLLVNTSRAEIVDHAAMLNAVMKKRIRAAVTCSPMNPRPMGTSTMNYSRSTMLPSPTISVPRQPKHNCHRTQSGRNCRHYAATGVALHCVNLASKTKASHLGDRHHDRIGVLAQVLDTLSQAEINVQSMSNEIFTAMVRQPVQNSSLQPIVR